MNESVLMASKRMAFTLPESLEGSIEKKNKEVAGLFKGIAVELKATS